MIRNVLFALLQFLLFLILFGGASFFPPFHLEQVIGPTADGVRLFIWDGLLLAGVLCVLILATEAFRKRLNPAGIWTSAAFALAVIAGLGAKFGFLTRQ